MIQPLEPHTTTAPLLQDGLRLTASEFHRRYEMAPHLKKAQLIDGVVYMPSPVRYSHSRPQSLIVIWLGIFQAHHPETRMTTDCTVILDEFNEVQPDALLFNGNSGRCRINEHSYIEGPPELVVEVAASTLDRDIGPKRDIYERLGVQEYLLWDVNDQQVFWWELKDQRYQPLPVTDNMIDSRIFPGLRLNVTALLADDINSILTTLQLGIQQHTGSTHG